MYGGGGRSFVGNNWLLFFLKKSAGEPFAQASFWTLFIRITKCKLVSNTHTSENYFQEFLASDFFLF